MKIPRSFLALVSILIILWLSAIGSNIWESLRGDYGWRWGYATPDTVRQVLLLAVIIIIYQAVSYILMQQTAVRWLLGWVFISGSAMAFAAMYAQTPTVYDELTWRTIASGPTGWHFASVQMDERGADEMLRDWPNVMENFGIYSSHITTSPPGFVLGYHATNHVFEQIPLISDRIGPPIRAQQCHSYTYNGYSNAQYASGALGGIFTPILTMLSVIPLYFLGKRFVSEGAARWAILWWPLVPAVLLFQPYPSVLYSLLTVSMVLMLMQGLTHHQRTWVFGAGLLMGFVTFLNFSPIALLLLVGLLALGIFFTQRTQQGWQWWWPFEMGVWYGVGLSSIWIAFYVLYGVSVIEMLDITFNSHLGLERPYWAWLFLHLYDFGFFLGWPVLVLALFGCWQWAKSSPAVHNIAPRWVLGGAVLLALALLDLSGTGRGETGRLWMYFMPYFLLMAGDTIQQAGDQRAGWHMTIVQGCVVLVLAPIISTIGTGLSDPPPTPTWETMPTTAYMDSGAVYGETIHLHSFAGYIDQRESGNSEPETVLKIWIRWTSDDYVEYPYFIGILPVAPDGSPQSAYVAQPFNDGDLPMTCWLPERGIIEDYYEIPINPADGAWWASVQILTREGATLGVAQLDGRIDHQVGIGPFGAN